MNAIENGERPTTEDLAGEWREFRREREDALRRPYDWLSVVGLAWVVADVPTAVADLPGRWWVSGGVLHVAAAAAEGLVLLDGDGGATDALDGEVTREVAEAGATAFALVGDLRIEVLRRGGYYALRLRDPQAPARTGFAGVPTWAFDDAWRVPVRLEPYDEPRTVVVDAAAPGLTQRATAVGEVVLVRDGVEHRLVATGRRHAWSVSFRDATSGVTSSAWRTVGIDGDPASGTGVLDLNRAVSYPYAFSDHGTCPAPIDGNALPFDVTAGEKAPAGRTGVPPIAGGSTALPGPQLLGGSVPD
ncbi:DUF1684 domain-containing protein [Serinibacter arcticus]|uniref:DUF1684 domain-containing protein n=1 Tax=Serinibacter arcticus TaxID=1655435 RepID=A0A4Z1E7Q7_9MICO|nr:DUF1684 domain-containing protein [Serinibacter arcticus]TGO06742.1 hypothetical protein SERN_0934 [Serinibacter arcticus]